MLRAEYYLKVNTDKKWPLLLFIYRERRKPASIGRLSFLFFCDLMNSSAEEVDT